MSIRAAGRLLAPVLLALVLAGCGAGASTSPLPSQPAPAVQPSRAPAPPVPTATPLPEVPGKIAFSKDHDLWFYQAGAIHRLTTMGSLENPAWSPDGRQLAFDHTTKNSADLWLLSIPDGQLVQLTNNTSSVVDNNFWEMQPAWSADGASLIYASDRGRLRTGTLDLAAWRMTLPARVRTQLSGANLYTGGIAYPAWRPGSATEVSYTSWTYAPNTTDAYGALILLNVRTGLPRALTATGETAMQASWSPDGSHVAVVRRENNQDEIWVAGVPDASPLENSQEAEFSIFAGAATRIVPGMNAHPVWSPNGDAVAYIGLKDGAFDLFVQPLTSDLRPDGQPRQLTSGLHVDADSAISWAR